MYLSSGHGSDCVNSVALSADGSKVVSGSNDDTVKIWSTETGQVLQTLSGDHGLMYIMMYVLYINFYICLLNNNNDNNKTYSDNHHNIIYKHINCNYKIKMLIRIIIIATIKT